MRYEQLKESVQDFLDSKYFYHSVRSDDDLDSIFERGLKHGTNASNLGGQAFEDEGGTVLVFKKSEYQLASKEYQGDLIVQAGHGKPVAILKDTDPHVQDAITDEQIDALEKKLEGEHVTLEKMAAGLAETLGVKVDEIWKLIWSRDKKRLTDEWFDYARRLDKRQDELHRGLEKLANMYDKKGPGATKQDVLNRYKHRGVPVYHYTSVDEKVRDDDLP